MAPKYPGDDPEEVQRAHAEAERLRNKLDLDRKVRNYAELYYMRLRDVRSWQGIGVKKVVAGSYYIAIRHTDEPCTLRELTNVTKFTKSDILTTATTIKNTLGIEIDLHSPETLLKRYSEDLSLSEVTKTHARKILETSQQEHPTGMSPRTPAVLAASAIYLAGRQTGERIEQQTLHEELDVSTKAIRTNYQTMEKYQ